MADAAGMNDGAAPLVTVKPNPTDSLDIDTHAPVGLQPRHDPSPAAQLNLEPALAPIPPQWVRKPSPEEFEAAFPRKALEQGVSGRVVLKCTTSVDLSLKDCLIQSEEPAGYGLGAAALQLSHAAKVEPGMWHGQYQTGPLEVPFSFVVTPAPSTSVPTPSGLVTEPPIADPSADLPPPPSPSEPEALAQPHTHVAAPLPAIAPTANQVMGAVIVSALVLSLMLTACFGHFPARARQRRRN